MGLSGVGVWVGHFYPSHGLAGLIRIQTPLKTRSTRLNAASWHLYNTRKWAFMLVFECFYYYCSPSPSLSIKCTSPPHQTLQTKQEQGEGVCFTPSPNKVCISSILTMAHHLITLFVHTDTAWTSRSPQHHWKQAKVLIFDGVYCFPLPPPNHLQKRARLLVFDGGYLFWMTTTQPPLKMSKRGWKWACLLVFDGSHLFFIITAQPPSKMSTHMLVYDGG